MSFTPNPTLVPDRDSLPLKKRDQRPQLQQLQQQQQCDAATFKVPFPYKSNDNLKIKHTSLFHPIPRRVPALYQPWMQTPAPTRSKPHVLSAFREHHSREGWRAFTPLHPGWDFSHHYQHLGGHHREISLYPGHPHHPSRFQVTEGFHSVGGEYGWEQLKTFRDKSLTTERQNNGSNKGPYVRRKDRREEYLPRVEKANPPSLSTCLPHSPHGDLMLQQGLLHKSTTVLKNPVSGAPLHSFVRVHPDNSNNTLTSTTENASRSPVLSPAERTDTSSSSSSSFSTSQNRFPWLLPHFLVGSLIELRDGRLRRVEHLQTEDFLLGSLACPDLRLSCCTVQSISTSASSSCISRLLILLHDQQSQELVDVYGEYPFFVHGRGWSSCSPQRTAGLCGLQCRQLSVGDVCLALTPVSAPQPSLSGTPEPQTSPRKSEGDKCESLKALSPQLPRALEKSTRGQKKEAETVRRRHYSAPELRGPGTNCLW